MTGKLYVVPTPIGNLGDMTFRAIEVLKEVDVVLAEDTRTSSKLLRHFEIDRPMWAFHMHNEHKKVDNIIEELQAGKNFALISDAGTPGVSDPGYLLVHRCVEEEIDLECLPGATAMIPALVLSGFPSDRFQFEGFLPPKKGRQTRLKEILESSRTTVLYESPHRVGRLMNELATLGGAERKVSLSREISKKFEETIRGTVSDLQAHFEQKDPKGEFVVVVSGLSKKKK